MPFTSVRDFTLLVDAVHEDGRWRYIAALFDGWPEEGKQLAEHDLSTPFYHMVYQALQQPSDAGCGQMLFDWVFPPNSQLREVFLQICAAMNQQGNLLRLWMSTGSQLEKLVEYHILESNAKVSWEGFWVREWKNELDRPAHVRSPFLALNSWVTIVRRFSEVQVKRHFPSSVALNVLIVLSNPPIGSKDWGYIDCFDRPDGSGIVPLIYQVLAQRQGIGWVHVLRNPTKAEFAAAIREHKPHIVIYLGHSYATPHSSGLVLPASEGGGNIEPVSGRREWESESELEQVLAGKSEALMHPGVQDEGLPQEGRPLLVILITSDAAAIASTLLRCGIPAVLAMRGTIPDSPDTEIMVRTLLTCLIDRSESVDASLPYIRQLLVSNQNHWSVPVLYLATKDQSVFPDEERFARSEYIRRMREQCGRFVRIFKDSPMNELTKNTYLQQNLGEMVKEKVQTPRGLEEREVEYWREFREALRLHRKLLIVGRAGRGKTSLLYWVVLTYLKVLENDETAVVPIYVPLKELQKMGSLKDLREYLEAKVAKGGERVSNWLWGHIQKGNVLLLLDALDEVPRHKRLEFLSDRGILANLVRELTSPQARIVMTCRDLVYSELSQRLSEFKWAGEKEGFVKMELKRFSRKQAVTYARQFFGNEEKAQGFLEDVEGSQGRSSGDERSSRYTHLAEEPLYLHMLCWLFAGMWGAKFLLPVAEDDLWHQIVVQLLEQRDGNEGQARDHLRLLEELAFHHLFCGKPLTRTFVEDTATWMADRNSLGNPRDRAEEWLADLEQWELLLRRDGGIDAPYEFAIPTLYEYFAFRHLMARWAEEDGAYRSWLPRASQGGWQRSKRLRCPNPYCRASLPPFRDLLNREEFRDIARKVIEGVSRQGGFESG